MKEILKSVIQKRPKLSWSKIRYPICLLIAILDLMVIEQPAIWIRLMLAAGLLTASQIPYLRHFTIPALPIFLWLTTFYAVQFIPPHLKPHIFVNLLPTLERIIYGANLSEIISKHTHPALDILAWLPYGILHFGMPFVVSVLLFVVGPPGSVAVFGRSFGYMNLAGVLTQLLFPNSPPWYELSYGSSPANYSIQGQAGGLARIDQILGLNLYGQTFGHSPLVFGAFPSLHSGCATLEMLYLGWLFPKARPWGIFHLMWMWFATMYLTHHYLIDLVGGSIYATLAFFAFVRPVVRPECGHRLDYLDLPFSLGGLVKSIELERFLQEFDLESVQSSESDTPVTPEVVMYEPNAFKPNFV